MWEWSELGLCTLRDLSEMFCCWSNDRDDSQRSEDRTRRKDSSADPI